MTLDDIHDAFIRTISISKTVSRPFHDAFISSEIE